MIWRMRVSNRTYIQRKQLLPNLTQFIEFGPNIIGRVTD